MATLAELRDAIANAVASIDGLRATALITDQINPPQAVVYRKATTYDEVQHGPGEASAGTWAFGILVYVQRTDERSSQNLLDEYAEPTGDKSIKTAVETDAALAAICDYVLVTDAGAVLVTTVGQIDYITEEFSVEIGVS